MSNKIKEAIKTWLWFDLCLAIMLWVTMGPEGIAEMACDAGVEDEVCEQFK